MLFSLFSAVTILQVTRVLGIFGALDPWSQSTFVAQIQDKEDKQQLVGAASSAVTLKQSSTHHNIGSEEYHQV